ncbi:hypothetical protein [Frigidibacter sp. ROC022]|uniref:hypothetical protein n=1 Tax=Frigidibacter sp. ROC022 TaxID=2971796 RepID=UPI00215ABE06|nr:hypothetical protein [Frigidibacter sp. ROC022]MCR8723469.1 hypothetical protein [Frigidibacter sp. ROC022]
MSSRPAPFLRPLSLCLALAPAPALACSTASTGAKCVGVGTMHSGGASGLIRKAPYREPTYKVGDTLPEEYQMLTNTGYYGLPPARDGWLYFRVEHQLFRVDRKSRVILEDATREANKAF